MKAIVINEWIGLFRNRVFLYLSVFFVLSLAVVTWLGIIQNHTQMEAQKQAHKHIRAQWDEMKPTNPHGAAHFGSYAFKPIGTLNSLDEGVDAVTGNVLRLEGHTQNSLVFSEASQSLLISKFGKLRPSLIFQFIIPLFLIFLSFNSLTNERDTGRLKLLIIQGASLQRLVFGKILSIWLLGFFLLLIAAGIQFLFNNATLSIDNLLRIISFMLSYAFYYFIITALTIYFSLIFKSNSASLSITLVVWILWSIFLPKISGDAVEKLTPLPTRIDFEKAMINDRDKGIDGHKPYDDRIKELEKSILAKYNVDTVSKLPINFDGVVMQADEEYGNLVWDKHFGELYKKFNTQKQNYQLSGIINPFASLQNLSMGASGTDMFHHLNFLKQAEAYRRVFIKTLNDKHAFGGSKTGDWNWKPEVGFFKSIKDFEYINPKWNGMIRKYVLDILFIVAWPLFLVFLIQYSCKKVEI